MTLLIRPYEPADLEPLSAIWFEASRRAHGFLGEARLREGRKLIEEVYLPQAENWVALRSDEPVGFIGLIDDFIGGLFVDPSAQGRGIGRALVARALRLKGRLELEVYAQNASARGFYERLGFQEILRRELNDEGLPFPNLRMRLEA